MKILILLLCFHVPQEPVHNDDIYIGGAEVSQPAPQSLAITELWI